MPWFFNVDNLLRGVNNPHTQHPLSSKFLGFTSLTYSRTIVSTRSCFNGGGGKFAEGFGTSIDVLLGTTDEVRYRHCFVRSLPVTTLLFVF